MGLLMLAGAAAMPQSAFAFGALAIDSNQGDSYGFSHNYRSKAAAEEEALQQCGSDCQVVLDFWNGCGAYAADQSRGSTVYGWGTGSSRDSAEGKALGECQDHGGDQCLVRVWACE